MRYLLDIPDLPPLAFRKGLGKKSPATLEGGKGDAPPAPDYIGAAQATAQGNLEATRAATRANRINQYTPYGKLTYSQNPSGQIDYSAYNKAMEDYNRALASYNSGQQTAPTSPFENRANQLMGGADPTGAQRASNMPMPGRAPRPEDFMQYDPDSGWSQTMTLNPQAQAALDQQLALNRKYGETANVGFDRVRELFENPQLDTSVLPERAINVGQTAQQAIMSRLSPAFEQREEALRQRLANQGIGLGSTAFGREFANFNQARNDAEMQAALQGINLDQANRSAALQEQAYLQDRPLNLINALRTGNQVANPQFQQFAQQATTAGPDLLGAQQAQYGAQMDAYNAQQANSPLGGLFSLAGAVGGLGIGNGMTLGGKALMNTFPGLFSDRRLKKNIKQVGKLDNGLNVYQYEYVWGGPTHIGVMAQEVEQVNPSAVFEVGGYKAVRYDQI